MSTDQEQFTLAITLADALAAYALRDKTDKHGKPLIEHSRRVWTAIRNTPGHSNEQEIAALLHDVVEETANDAGRYIDGVIDRLFGRSIGNLVAVLSYDADREEYQSYIETVALFQHARAIKLADLADNLDTSRGPIEPSLKQRYEKAKQLLIDQDEYERQIRNGNGAAINPHPQARA